MNYLIPANTKRGRLILGFFRPMDLVILGCGVLASLILMASVDMSSPFITIFVLTPGVICGFLVLPVPYYHNVLNIIVELYEFISNRQTYRWKGWCYKLGYKNKKSK